MPDPILSIGIPRGPDIMCAESDACIGFITESGCGIGICVPVEGFFAGVALGLGFGLAGAVEVFFLAVSGGIP